MNSCFEVTTQENGLPTLLLTAKQEDGLQLKHHDVPDVGCTCRFAFRAKPILRQASVNDSRFYAGQHRPEQKDYAPEQSRGKSAAKR